MQTVISQLKGVPPAPYKDLVGKTVVVVGANNGIGYETAKHFATMGPRLILACRSQERGEAALTKIKQETGCQTAELWMVDLTSFASVNAFVELFDKEVDRLDLLIENAALIAKASYPETDDDWEPSVQTNNISTSLLALLLLPKMLKTAERYNTVPRIVVVSSRVHGSSKFEKDFIEGPNPLKLFGSKDYLDVTTAPLSALAIRYQDTKLLNIFFTRALAARLGGEKSSLVVNAVNPGFCVSGLRGFLTGFRGFINWLMEKAIAWTAEQGSRQLLWAALAKESQINGAYVSEMSVMEPSDYVLSEEGRRAQDVFWDNLIDELVKINPRVREIVEQYLIY